MNIAIDAKVLFEMQEYAAWANEHYDAEIAGWGHYSHEEGIYKLAPLTRQVVHGAEALATPDELLKTDYDMSDMIVQWHSHVNMGCTPSQPDIQTRNEIAKLSGLVVSIIINLKGEHTCNITVAKANGFEFDTPHTMKSTLLPYYVNQNISKIVKKKLRLPPPPKVVKKVSGNITNITSAETARNTGEEDYLAKAGNMHIIPDATKTGYTSYDEILYDVLVIKLLEEKEFTDMMEIIAFDDNGLVIVNVYTNTRYVIHRKQKRAEFGIIFIDGVSSSWAELMFDVYGAAMSEHMITNTENTRVWLSTQEELADEERKKIVDSAVDKN